MLYAKDNLEKITSKNYDSNSTNIYIADIESIKTIIQKSGIKYKIVYNFSATCPSSTESFPKIMEFLKTHNDFELIPIVGYRYTRFSEIKEYLEKIQYYSPVYFLDTELYGNKRNPFKRLDLLTKTICKDCIYQKMGFSSFYVLDQSNNVCAHNNWDIIGNEKMQQLYDLVNK